METTHPSQPSLRWEIPVLLFILFGVAACLWCLSGEHVPPTSWHVVGAILPKLPQLWMHYGLRVLPLVILLFIEASELPVALVFVVISVWMVLRFLRPGGSSLDASNKGSTLAQRSTSGGVQASGPSSRQLVSVTQTYPSSQDTNNQAVRAYIASNSQVGEKLCGVFALVDGRASAENEAGLACLLVSQVLRDLLQEEAPSDPVRPSDTFKQLLVQNLERANHRLFQHNQNTDTTLRAMVTVLVVLEQVAYIAHIGINRAYLYREREGLYQITSDHGHTSENSANTPEQSSTEMVREAFRQLGTAQDVLCDVMTIPLREGDMILLCSDGIWSALSDTGIEQILAGKLRESQMAEQMVQIVQQHRGNEWVSLILTHLVAANQAWMSEGTQ